MSELDEAEACLLVELHRDEELEDLGRWSGVGGAEDMGVVRGLFSLLDEKVCWEERRVGVGPRDGVGMCRA